MPPTNSSTRVLVLAVLLASCGSLTAACHSAAPARRGGTPESPPAKELAARVRSEFLHAWRGYRRYAWGHDALKPLSRSHHDWYRQPLLITPVDALDTMLLMGLEQEAREAIELIVNHLSFDHDSFVRTFEVNIRLVGGLLSGYQLSGDRRLLRLAEELGRRLLPAFASATGMPYGLVNLRTGAVRQPLSNPAEVGTAILEFGTLSNLTGDPVFGQRAMFALRALYQRRSWLGLVGEAIDVETGRWASTASHVGSGIDSYYEYLYKCALLFQDSECAEMWQTSITAVHRHLADQRAGELWYRRTDMTTGRELATHFGALDCFFPGLLVLSGDLRRAAALQRSCQQLWSKAGLIPEVADYSTMTVLDGRYLLRPEIIESTYYLYRATRNPAYRHSGQRMLADLLRHCRVESGYAALEDVLSKRKRDEMESFFLAETLKYLYLLFADPDPPALRGAVFNTEAHPLRLTKLRGRDMREPL